jgi:hypothetical protein
VLSDGQFYESRIVVYELLNETTVQKHHPLELSVAEGESNEHAVGESDSRVSCCVELSK